MFQWQDYNLVFTNFSFFEVNGSAFHRLSFTFTNNLLRCLRECSIIGLSSMKHDES